LLEIIERPPRRARELGLGGDQVNRFFTRALGRDVDARPKSSVELVAELEVALRTSFRAAAITEDAGASLPTQRVKPLRRRVA
jgi:hypothetical protein